MLFQTDPRIDKETERRFGEYLITFYGETNQVRADLFRRGGEVKAYVSFSPGLYGGNATDHYYGELWDYAREHGFADQFKVVYTHSRTTPLPSPSPHGLISKGKESDA